MTTALQLCSPLTDLAEHLLLPDTMVFAIYFDTGQRAEAEHIHTFFLN